jgi:hypothetical protein
MMGGIHFFGGVHQFEMWKNFGNKLCLFWMLLKFYFITFWFTYLINWKSMINSPKDFIRVSKFLNFETSITECYFYGNERSIHPKICCLGFSVFMFRVIWKKVLEWKSHLFMLQNTEKNTAWQRVWLHRKRKKLKGMEMKITPSIICWLFMDLQAHSRCYGTVFHSWNLYSSIYSSNFSKDMIYAYRNISKYMPDH